MVWLTSDTNSCSGMTFASRAKMRWDSSSELEPTAIPRNLANSLSLVFLLPSAIFAGMDNAARKIWLRNEAYCVALIVLLTRSILSESA